MTKKPRVHKKIAHKDSDPGGKPFDPPTQPNAPVVNPPPLIERPPYGGGDDDQ